MTHLASNIVKKDNVRFSGTRVLDQDSPSAQPASSPGDQPQPRIVENKDGLIVIEITCECGRKMYLHCDCRGN
jgi:hypothetical protein